jgi:hypothetical protein
LHVQGAEKVLGIEISIQKPLFSHMVQTNYIPNESPENSRQENIKFFKNRHLHKKIPIKVVVRKNSTAC